jgi:acetyl esterase/lipase
MMKTYLIVSWFFLGLSLSTRAETTAAALPVPDLLVNVWPDGKMPGHGAAQPEQEAPSSDKRVLRITDVSEPTLAVFKAPQSNAPGPAVLVCPGGGYKLLAYDLEGTDVAKWLNGLGITAVVLKYRVPDNREGAYQDVQRAMRLMRLHATDWNIDPERLGIIGFSAGGHLAARLSCNYEQPAYPGIDEADQLSCEPKFVILGYPAFLETKGQIVPELPITDKIPQTFLFQARDDKYFFASGSAYHAALDAAKVPNQFIIYPTGGHGFGLRSKKAPSVWPTQAAEWLHTIGIL